jgi:exonuclease III
MTAIQLFILLGVCLEYGFHTGVHTNQLPFSYCHRSVCRPTVTQQITEKRFVGKRITLYPNSTSSFRYRLLLAGDVEPNPGPIDDNGDLNNLRLTTPTSTAQTKRHIKYSRDDLLNLNGPYRMSSATWLKLKDLKLNANPPTRRKKHSKHTATVSTTITRDESEARSDVHHKRGVDDLQDPNPMPEPISSSPEIDNDIFNCLSKKGFHCIHINARSLPPKMSELKVIASKTKVSIIAISESWLDDSVTNCEIDIPGFSVIRNDRNREGGGVCIYVKSSLAFNLRSDLHDPKLESLWVEILLPMCKPIIIGACYRSQTHTETDFINRLEHILTKLPSDSDVIVLGDTNICKIRDAKYEYKIYENMLHMAGFKQLISTPTRVTDSSKSIIDHVLCNNMQKISQYGVIKSGLSDHYTIYCTRKHIKTNVNSHKGIKIRSLKKYSKECFVEMLKNVDWSSVYR